jgi:chemotaxis protein MotC
MKRAIHRHCLSTAVLASILLGGGQQVRAEDDLPPYVMLRSLQFVQDSVARGDHSAVEMQRFLITTLDKRLRSADATVFQDTRNVDAVFIYAMSGGNPATLEYLVSRDIQGHFDSRVADALRKYLSGKGTSATKSISEMVPEYLNTSIGPYLALVTGNIAVASNVDNALGYFDQARLSAPGTIIEEAALRRSLSISLQAHMVKKSLFYASRYARSFLYSPYASQFADMFVQLVVENYGTVTQDDMDQIVALLDAERGREIYLRIARRANLVGNKDLARIAATQADKITGNVDDGRRALPGLYEGMANISTPDVVAASQAIAEIPDETLSDRDRALRNAAQSVAAQILQKPDASSLTQGIAPRVDTQTDASLTALKADTSPAAVGNQSATNPLAQTTVGGEADKVVRDFVSQGRSKLTQIDELLAQESPK